MGIEPRRAGVFGMTAWSDHPGHSKLEPLSSSAQGQPEPYVRQFLGAPSAEVTVLDVGCGRGDRVAWLCQQGWDAYGADIADAYLEQGRGFMDSAGYGAHRLQSMPDGRIPFGAGTFDIVLSDQVFEHVADLDSFAAELGRVTKVGGRGLHVFPARWRPIEPHMRTPFVHWFPKGRARKGAMAAALRAGLAVDHFDDRPARERTEIFYRFSESETFYRSRREIQHTFAVHGMDGSFLQPAQEKLAQRLPRLPGALLPLASTLYTGFHATYFSTTQIGQEASRAPGPERATG
jgi:SAM-dependent methyltransferase